MARFVVVWLMASAIGVLLLAIHGPWLVIPLITFSLAWICYRGSVAAAEAYGDTLVWALDLYRFDLVEQLRFPLPMDHADELKRNRTMMEFIRGDRYILEKQGAKLPPLPPYRHPDLGNEPREERTNIDSTETP
jgi:hypothetical protein